MEELFLQLRREVGRLRELCSEQGRLLQSLRAGKGSGPAPDIPVSLPVQCTEDAGPGGGQRSPEGHQIPPEAPASSTSHPEGSAQPTDQPRLVRRIPPGPGSGVGTVGASGGAEGDVPTWMRTWMLPVPREGGRAPCGPRELEAPNPGAGGSFPNLLDLYETPAALGSEDAPRESVLLVEAPNPGAGGSFLNLLDLYEAPAAPGSEDVPRESVLLVEAPNPGAGGSFPNFLDLYEAPAALGSEDAPREGLLHVEAPVEIRGPVKTSWSPGWALEEGTLGSGSGPASEEAPACDLCREIFPSDPAGHTEYLSRVLARLE